MDGRCISQVNHIELTGIVLLGATVTEIDNDCRFVSKFEDATDISDISIVDVLEVFDLHDLVAGSKLSLTAGYFLFACLRWIDHLSKQFVKVTVPFKRFLGYDRGPDGNLVLNKDEAVIIRRIYSMFLQGMTPHGIASRLTSDGIKSPGGKDKWNAGAVRSILTNEKYKGDALLQKSYTVDFLTKKKKVNEGEIPQYYVEGNHEAIIQPEIFELVQQELERRKNSRGRHSGVHLFSSKIKCGQCGEWYGSKVWHSNSKYRRVIWQCNHKYDGEEKCSTPHLTEDEIKTMFVSAVNKLISNKDAVLAPLRASLDIAFDTSALEAETEELQSEIMVTSDLIQKCICENAHVALDQTEYQKRYDGLTARFDSAKAQLEEIDSAIADKKSRRATIEAFMDTLAQADLMEKFDPALWCGLVDFVTVYSKDDVRFTFRNGMEIKA